LFAAESEAVLILYSDGFLATDVRPLVRLSLSVIVEEGRQRASPIRPRHVQG
jgi:predicted Zn-dependent protease